MNDQRRMLADTVDGLFAEIASEPTNGWERVSELAVPDLFLSEDDGGFGGNWQDACVVFQAAGRHALPLPAAETMLARALLRESAVDIPDAPLALGLATGVVQGNAASARVNARIDALAWHDSAGAVLTVLDGEGGELLLLLDPREAKQRRPCDGAPGEARADLVFENATPLISRQVDGAANALRLRGAMMRAAQMAGALEAALELSITHVNERQQFGRALAKFQAIQHQLALLAEEAAAVGCAAEAAALALDNGDGSMQVAAAKLRANRSVYQATSIAHQVHGAIGFTREHRLHHFTQRLWRWRGDFGNERFWANELGRRVLAAGREGLWGLITGVDA